MDSIITVHNARLHNLKNIDVQIPKNKLVVITGVSGSGKSTLAFDILNKEGQRQYLESLGLVTWGVSKPPVDSITGLSPSISVEQHLIHHNPRSTVGTITEVYTYLRILYAKLGQYPCPECGKIVKSSLFNIYNENLLDEIDDNSEETFPCPHCKKLIPKMSMADFSFNKPVGACPTCTGLGVVRQVIINQLIDENKNIFEGAVNEWVDVQIARFGKILQNASKYFGFTFGISKKIKNYNSVEKDLLLYGTEDQKFLNHFPNIKPPNTNVKGKFEGLVTNIQRRYDEHAENPNYRKKLDHFFRAQICKDCNGKRLRSDSILVKIAYKSIIEISQSTLRDLDIWLKSLLKYFTSDEMLIAQPILDDLTKRIENLIDVGVGYLTLERSSPSLSVGEVQKLRLASLLGSGLTGVLYVLDEPTVGLHPRDTNRLINVLYQLRDLGNTLLVVEHDLDVITAADFIIDMGPGGGINGGEVIATGTPSEISNNKQSLTGAYINQTMKIPIPKHRRLFSDKVLKITGARQNNLRNLDVKIPLGLLVAVTGVSGSGKSSLIFDILGLASLKHLGKNSDLPGDYDSITGWDNIDNIITIDQSQVVRIPRSNPATYLDIFTPIRKIFASTTNAINNNISISNFSFNIPGGRCEHCKGLGTVAIKMHFLPEIEIRCSYCHGRRFKSEILDIKYRNHNISEVLDLTVDEALDLFFEESAIRSHLQIMSEVGLGYLQLGQPTTTLSGGEAQRIKLAKELGKQSKRHILYLLDEPTTGLHPDDIKRLLVVLQRLVENDNSVIVIEHNLDLIKAADWIIDLGPEGDKDGGQIIAEGTPENVTEIKESYTGNFLRSVLLF